MFERFFIRFLNNFKEQRDDHNYTRQPLPAAPLPYTPLGLTRG